MATVERGGVEEDKIAQGVEREEQTQKEHSQPSYLPSLLSLPWFPGLANLRSSRAFLSCLAI